MSVPAPIINPRPRVTPTTLEFWWSPPVAWIAGSDGEDKLIYSTNGLTWTASGNGNSIFDAAVFAIAYGNGRWIAGGTATNTLAYSYDGITWTGLSDTIFTDACTGIGYGNNMWVACGRGQYILAHSNDGINWVGDVSDSIGDGGDLCATVAYANSKWVAGKGSKVSGSSISYSTNGINWTATGFPLGNGCNSVAYGGLWVAGGGGDGGSNLAYSSDGQSWTDSSNGDIIFSVCNAVAYGNGIWVAGGDGDNTLAYSTDGITWSIGPDSNILSDKCLSVSYANGLWIAGGYTLPPPAPAPVGDVNVFAYSTNGINWTLQPIISGITQINAVKGVSSQDLIVGYILESTSPSISINVSPSATSRLVTGLTPLTDYTFTLKTDLSGSYSAPATFRKVRTSDRPQSVATLTKSESTVNGALNLTLNWTNPADYAAYYVYSLRVATSPYNTIYTGTSDYATLTRSFTGLDTAFAYIFTIQRGNDAGYSTKTSLTTSKTLFDPRTITGLRFWVDATDASGAAVADGTTITTWYDKSGTSNNATSSSPAILRTDAVGRYLDMSGSWYSITNSSWVYNQYFTFFIVEMPASYFSSYNLIGTQAVSTDSIDILYNTNIVFSTYGDNSALGSAFSSVIPAPPVNIWCFSNYGGKTAYWNKLVSGKDPAHAASFITDSLLSIGATNGSTNLYSGKMREILMYRGVMAENDREAVSNYLANKWSTQPTTVPLAPVKNSAILWLDAADITTLFQDAPGTIPVQNSGDPILLWKDKSGFENNMTTITGQYTTGINNLPAYFNNSTEANTQLVLQPGDASLFMVVRSADTPVTGDYFFHHDQFYNSVAYYFSLECVDTGLISWHVSANKNNNRLPVGTAPFIFYGTMKKQQILTGAIIDAGVTSSYTIENTDFTVSVPDSATIGIGDQHNQYYSEVIYYNRALSDAEVQQNVAYLQQKWGFTPSAVAPNLPELQLWLDAADPYTVFQDGDEVTVWKDRSSHGNNAVPQGAPTFNNGVIFDGTQYFSLPDGALPLNNYSYYIVAKLTGASSIIHGGSGALGNTSMNINTVAVTGGIPRQYATTIFGAVDLSDTNIFPEANIVIIESIYDVSGKRLFLSGLTGATDTSAHTQDASNNYLGWDTSTGYLNGTIYEVLVYGTAHTAQQRKEVEAYLRNKWIPSSYVPDVSGMGLWLDAASASNFDLSGSAVNTWTDKTGICNVSQTATWAKPLYSLDSVAGKYGVQFGADAIATGLSSSASPFGSTSSWSVFTVHRYDYSTADSLELINNMVCTAYEVSGGSPIVFNVGTTYASPNISELQFTAMGTVSNVNAEIHRRPVMTSQVVANPTYNAYTNGTLSAASSVDPMTSDAKINLGFTGTLTPSLNGALRGYIYEVIIFNAAITFEEQQTIEGYLAWKWGIPDLLPGAHPYYLGPP